MNQYLRVYRNINKYFSTLNANNHLEKLNERSLLKVSGKDAASLLQGLITNDIQHLNYGIGSMFTMFLNNKGRVLYDSIIYRTTTDDSYILEVDKMAANELQSHLNMYRLRRDVKIDNVDDMYQLWVLFNPNKILSGIKDKSALKLSSLSTEISEATQKSAGYANILIFRDPRLSVLGSRILAPATSEPTIIELFGKEGLPKYKWYRYQLGVGEGIDDLPTGNCFPLEANCDYLNGVSFQKGCYIGQELTARTHHTGVIRKRLMPVFFNTNLGNKYQKDENIKAGETTVGKLRGVERDIGLGLLRIAQVLECKSLFVNFGTGYTLKPTWWPTEAPKEKLSQKEM